MLPRALPRPGLAAGAALAAAILLTGCAPRTQAVAAPAPTAATAPSTAAATADVALLPVRYDATSGKLFLTIPRLDEDLLYLNTLATGLGRAGLDRGEVGVDAVVRFERRGARILLVRQNTAHRAVGGDAALARSVEESFPNSVLASFKLESEGPAGVVVDATDFFLSDVFDVVGRLRSSRLGAVRVDRERSFIAAQRTRAFPQNTEVHAVLSYVSDDPSFELRRHAPDGRTITFEQRHSFLRLPKQPLAVRDFDPRAGLFSANFFDFAQPFDSDYRQRGVVRWRLEPSDTAAYLRGERVVPVRPIVYYLDPAIPEPYRSAFLEGGAWWNGVFEAAGWKNGFRVEVLPEGADPMDARYPMVYWVHRQQRGPSVGPSLRDPRTGEIMTTVVRMDTYRSLVDHDIYMGLLPAAGTGGLGMSAEQFSMARRRQHVAHEIGHTLGLAHNFAAAAQGRASVMDYPYPLIGLDAGGALDLSAAFRASGGAHDTLAIRYAYSWYPTPEAEAAGLKSLVREAEARGLRFVGDRHAVPEGSYPTATQWIEGDDMPGALDRTFAVRRLLMSHFDARAAQPGEPLAVLNRRFAHVYLHHRYALQGATKTVGGLEFGYALAGEATEPTRVIAAAEQRRALGLVLRALQPAELRIPERVTALIPPVPPGYDADLELIATPAGTAFDPLAAAHSLAQEVVDGLLHPERAARLVSFHARDARNPSLDEVLGALIDTTWGATPARSANAYDETLRRVVQRATLDGLLDLAGNPAATPAVRAAVEHRLSGLRPLLAQRGGPAEQQAHRATALRDVDRYFEGKDDPARRPRPAPIALPWP